MSVVKALAVVLLGVFLSSCASTGGESDLPWNEPQGWEGHPNIPIGTY